jgi:hypothetical protein
MKSKSFRDRIYPAIQGFDGQIKIGPRGSFHLEIRYNNPESDGTVMKGDAGFYDPVDKKFYHKYGENGLQIDSQRLEPEKSIFENRPKQFANFKRLSAEMHDKILKDPTTKVTECQN